MNSVVFLYCLLIGGSSAALALSLHRARRPASAGAGSPGLRDHWEAAFLTGGPGQVADAVISGMHADGRLATGGPGIVAVARAHAADPVEAAVLSVHAAADNGSLHALRSGVMLSRAVQDIGDGLAERGLMVRPDRLRWLRRWAFAHNLLCVLSFPLAIVLTAVPAVQEFGANESMNMSVPLAVAVIPAAIVGLVVGTKCAGRARTRITGAGQDALRRYRAANAGRRDTAYEVAVGGTAALQDPVLRARLSSSRRRPVDASASTSSSDSTAPTAVVIWCGADGGSHGGGSCGSASSCGSSSSSCGSSGGSSCSSSSSSSSCGGGGGSSCS